MEDVSTLAFIRELRVTHPLYKNLVKYVTHWSEVLYWAQPYIQLEKAMKSSANQSLIHGGEREKLKRITEAPPLTTKVTDEVLSRNRNSRTPNRVYSEFTKWITTSLH